MRDPLAEDIKIIVPEEMLKASVEALRKRWGFPSQWELAENQLETQRISLEAALRWQSERSPDIPVHTIDKIAKSVGISRIDTFDTIDLGVRQMYRAPEPEVPEILEGMMFSAHDIELHLKNPNAKQLSEHLNSYIIEAYRCGLHGSGSK